MKRILFIPASILLFVGTQTCGEHCSSVNAQVVSKKHAAKDDLKTVKLKITGMTCAGCSNHVSTAIKDISGVIEHSLEYPGDIAIIKYNSKKTSPSDLIKAIEKVGYTAEISKDVKKKKNDKRKTKVKH